MKIILIFLMIVSLSYGKRDYVEGEGKSVFIKKCFISSKNECDFKNTHLEGITIGIENGDFNPPLEIDVYINDGYLRWSKTKIESKNVVFELDFHTKNILNYPLIITIPYDNDVKEGYLPIGVSFDEDDNANVCTVSGVFKKNQQNFFKLYTFHKGKYTYMSPFEL